MSAPKKRPPTLHVAADRGRCRETGGRRIDVRTGTRLYREYSVTPIKGGGWRFEYRDEAGEVVKYDVPVDLSGCECMGSYRHTRCKHLSMLRCFELRRVIDDPSAPRYPHPVVLGDGVAD